MTRLDFTGKVILVTGAAGGLGAALCRRFAFEGAHIAALDLDPARPDARVATLPTGTRAISGNIADPAVIRRVSAEFLIH